MTGTRAAAAGRALTSAVSGIAVKAACTGLSGSLSFTGESMVRRRTALDNARGAIQ
jgi:hypothetical protein